jgi:hypothetical protein
MRGEVLAEPELEFGGGGRHIDIRYGLNGYGPFDRWGDERPQQVSVGIVGTSETAEGLLAWLESCRTGIPAKNSRLRHLFPAFPGFSADSPFGCELLTSDRLTGVIPSNVLKELATRDRGAAVQGAVTRFVEECARLTDNHKPDLLICLPPAELLEAMDPPQREAFPWARKAVASLERAEDEPAVPPPAFHDVLKAGAMDLGVPIQMVRPETYDPSKRRLQKQRPERPRALQDSATRAWNIHTAMYYKAGGTPWRLPHQSTALSACFVGVSFYKTAEGDRLMTSMAQVFNELGDGVVVRGGAVKINKDDRQPHLTREGAAALLRAALGAYRAEHRALPARLVVHKTSAFNTAERLGVLDVTKAEKVDWVDLLSLRKSRTRLLRHESLPPLRGTTVTIDDSTQLLYARGSVDFYRCYPGMYIPRPLELRIHHADSSPRALAAEVLALSKMNWNNTQFDGGEPVTTRVARQVGNILRHVPEGAKIQARYSYYM